MSDSLSCTFLLQMFTAYLFASLEPAVWRLQWHVARHYECTTRDVRAAFMHVLISETRLSACDMPFWCSLQVH
jgi:hypothetical protein